MAAAASAHPAARAGRRPSLRVLIVNPFGIGDVLFTTPLLRALRQAFPGAYLGYLCNRRTEPILRNNSALDELFVYEKDELRQLSRQSAWRGLRSLLGLLRRIRRARFDMMVDLSLGERYALVLGALGIRRRVGFNYRRRGRFLTERLPIEGYHDRHVVEYYQQLLAFLGITMRQAVLELRVSDEDARWAQRWLDEHRFGAGRPLIGLVPAGGVSWGIDAPFRRWSSEGFAAVGDVLAQRYGARLILFGERTDRPICEAVNRGMRQPCLDVSGQTTLGQFVSLLSRLDLVICNDGGPLHLAVSQRVKTVSIFGPVDPWVYGPYPTNPTRHRVIMDEALPCRPCYHQFRLPPCPYERACLTHIKPEAVVEACAALLEQGAAAAHG